jgi:hypothetical protein
MSDSDLQTLTDFRSEVPEPDEETARRIYALSTALMSGRRCDVGRLMRSRRSRLEPPLRHVRPRRRLIGVTAAGVALAAAAAVVAFLTVGSSGVTPGVENAAAAIKKAATLTAASADKSGTVNVRITHDGQLWASKVIRWNAGDVELSDTSGRPQSGYPLLVVDGTMYGHGPEYEGWIELGPTSSIDPGSGTTPTEQLDAIREDVGGTTLRRMIAAMTASGLTTTDQSDGSTVYSGTVPAGQIAGETGFKEGQAIRVFPFGYVAHDAAADPASLLDTAVTVGAEGVTRETDVKWGTWTYTVTYSDLGSTPPIIAPANAKTLRELRHLPPGERPLPVPPQP